MNANRSAEEGRKEGSQGNGSSNSGSSFLFSWLRSLSSRPTYPTVWRRKGPPGRGFIGAASAGRTDGRTDGPRLEKNFYGVKSDSLYPLFYSVAPFN